MVKTISDDRTPERNELNQAKSHEVTEGANVKNIVFSLDANLQLDLCLY